MKIRYFFIAVVLVMFYGCEQGNVSKARLMDDPTKKQETAASDKKASKEANETLELQKLVGANQITLAKIEAEKLQQLKILELEQTKLEAQERSKLEESKLAYESLSTIHDIKLLRSNSLEYEQGVVVIPAYLAKGIEFDAVIIYDASALVYDDERLRRMFYTACTRAMHHLQLYSVGEPTPLLQNVLNEKVIERS